MGARRAPLVGAQSVGSNRPRVVRHEAGPMVAVGWLAPDWRGTLPVFLRPENLFVPGFLRSPGTAGTLSGMAIVSGEKAENVPRRPPGDGEPAPRIGHRQGAATESTVPMFNVPTIKMFKARRAAEPGQQVHATFVLTTGMTPSAETGKRGVAPVSRSPPECRVACGGK